MLSPTPALQPHGDEAGPLLSPGSLLAASPVRLFYSPGRLAAPGAHVVQEGRLSLEMFGMGTDGGEYTANAGPAGALTDLLSPISMAALPKPGPLAAPKATSVTQNPAGHPNPHSKLTPPALFVATSEQMEAKEIYAAKQLEALPARLTAEMQQTMAAAKASVGLPGLNSSNIAAHLTAVLTEAPGTAAPRLAPLEPQQLETPATEAEAAAGAQPQRGTKRQREEIAEEVDPATLPPSKRVERMNELYQDLRETHQRNNALDQGIRASKAELNREEDRNEALWSMIAHIGAAMHGAIEDLDGVDEEGGDEAAAAAAETARQPAAAAAAMQQPAMVMAVNLAMASAADHSIAGTAALPPLPPQLQQQQQVAMPATLVPLHPTLQSMTPGTAGLGSLFSPSGEDLFAACGMFISPNEQRDPSGAVQRTVQTNLFPDADPSMPPALAALIGIAPQQQQQPDVAAAALARTNSNAKSFSFPRLSGAYA